MIEMLREKARKLPMQPGVYIMLDKAGAVIYVGKAKLLRNRVSSYFVGEHNAKTEAMISKIADFNVIIAGSEFEALVLENSLIKHHMPRYNILLKDDKGYPFIRVDLNEEYPTFSIVSKPGKDGAKYFGPYGGRSVTRNAIDAVKKALKLPTCSRRFPRDIGKERPCLNYHMGTCLGYCLEDTDRNEYKKAAHTAMLIFEGKTHGLVAELQKEMERDAEELRFELAAEKRDRIKAIKALTEKQRVVAGSAADTDAVGFYRGTAKSCFVVLHYIGGDLLDKDFELIETPMEEDGEALSGILRQYYERRGVFPKNIFLPAELPDGGELEQMFTEISGRRVYIACPQRGEKRRLVDAACVNAREETERATTKEEKTVKTLQWLMENLGLKTSPERIEAFDISNTGSEAMVASMTVFQHGRPKKKDYRKFKIKTLTGQDDFHSMKEVVYRRLMRYKEGDEKFAPLPDLMLIDGGAVHASMAVEASREAGVPVSIFGMVKDDRHRTRALITPEGMEIGIVGNPAVFAFVGNIQEETHRFAIDYHRSLRSKNTYKSRLESIPGVGEKRKNALLKRFGSMKAIAAAELDELLQVVPRDAAGAVYEYFHREKKPEVGEE